MRWLSSLNHYRRDNPLAVRLLASILLFSSLITLLSTALQIYLDYRHDRSEIDNRILQIEASSLDNLNNSVWLINPEQIQLQLNGLQQLPDVVYLQLDTAFNQRFSAGSPPGPRTPLVSRYYPLEHTTPEGEFYQLGNLQLHISLEGVYRHLQERILVIFMTQGVKTFLVSVFILYLFWFLVTQHLATLARYAASLTSERLDQPLSLRRTAHPSGDELSQVVRAINGMRLSLLEDIARRERAEHALAELNSELEARVTQRTAELEQSNRELNLALSTLKKTQTQLVEAEKMAALGNLVAGVAHEINTPLGIGVTAATYLRDQAQLNMRQQAAILTPAQSRFNALALESSELITGHLQRAAQLISAFKQVSVDQSSERQRSFPLRAYLDEIVLSLSPRLKQISPTIIIDCPSDLSLNSYPGALYQVISNLMINSLIHGFGQRTDGKINIAVTPLSGSRTGYIQLLYRDNGCGIASAIKTRLFEPFVTTRRGEGCSGLGMHIAYNLTTQLLQGQIHLCEATVPEHPGVCFELILPVQPGLSHRPDA